jgi:hypothetical protein
VRVSEPAVVAVCFGLRSAMIATISTATPITAMRTPASFSRRCLRAACRATRPSPAFRRRCRGGGPSAGAGGWRATGAVA